MIAPHQEQLVPVRVYQGGERLMAMMPLPGVEPQDISVVVRGDRVVVHAEYRGPHQEERDLLIAEWAIGPYHRELVLPHAVDGARTNATYGNGVLVLVMPRLAPGGTGAQDGWAEFRLEVIEATRGAHVGHTGHDLQQTTTAAYRQRQEEVARRAGGQRE